MSKRILLIVAAISPIFIIFLAFWYFYYNTPLYTVNAISKCIRNHDWENFQKWVDVDAFISSITDRRRGDIEENDFAFGLTKMLSGTINNAAKEELRKSVENPNVNMNQNAFFGAFSPETYKRNGLKSKKKGKLAILSIPEESIITDRTKYYDVVFRNENFHYRIIGINMDEFTSLPSVKKIDSKKNFDNLKKKIPQQTTIGTISAPPIEAIISIAGTEGMKFLKVVIVLEYDDRKFERLDDELSNKQAELKNMLIEQLSGLTLDELKQPGSRTQIRKKYKLAVNNFLPENIGKIDNVYISEFIIQ